MSKISLLIFFAMGTLLIIFSPWLVDLDLLFDTIKGIFPIKRGLYQLKVASFWCITDVIFKWE